MVFSSLTFLFAFLPVSLLLYYVVPGKWKDVVLFAVSLLFYAWGEPVYVFLMLYSIILNYRMGLAMERYPERKKQTMIFAVVLNLAMLGFFKYYGFVVENLNRILPFTIPERKLPLPIVLHTGSLLGTDSLPVQFCAVRRIYYDVPAADRRTDRAVQRH